MSPSTERPSSRSSSTSGAASSGAQPPFWSSPDTFTWTRTRAPADRRAISVPRARRSTACQSVMYGARRRTLLRWSRPIDVPADVGTLGHLGRLGLGHQLLGVVLTDVDQAGIVGGHHDRHLEGLGHRHDGHRVRIRPQVGDLTPDDREPFADLLGGRWRRHESIQATSA